MTKNTKATAAASAVDAHTPDIWRFADKRPLVIAALGLALGTLVGSLLRFMPGDRQVLGRRSPKLGQASKLKDSASELALDGYDQARSMLATTQHLPVGGVAHTERRADQNPLVISDSGH